MSKTQTRTTLLPVGARIRLKKWFFDFVGLFLFFLALIIMVSFITYSHSDTSFNTSSSVPIQNQLGAIGSHIADLFLQSLGLACYLIPLVIGAWGWRLFKSHFISAFWARLIFLLLGILLFTLFLSVIETPENWPLHTGLGGISGNVLLLLVTGIIVIVAPGFENSIIVLGTLPLALMALGFSSGLNKDEWRKIFFLVKSLFISLNHFVRYLKIRQTSGHKRQDPHFNSQLRSEGGNGEVASYEEEPVPLEAIQADPVQNSSSTLVEDVSESRPKIINSVEAKQGSLILKKNETFILPPLDFLVKPDNSASPETTNKNALSQNAKLLETVLQDFGIKGKIVKVRPGPVVTLYELEPAPGTKTSRVVGLSDDIARSMSALSVRIAVIPGRSVIGIELPNFHREIVYFRELLGSSAFKKSNGALTLVLGKDIGGTPSIVDLSRMPHLLIAGTTGSGKSVAINTMICSLLYRLTPNQCKFIMIDPKMLELSVYDGIPHLLTPVVTEPPKAIFALKWAVREMEERYRLMSQMGVRNILGYNARLSEANKGGEILTRKVQTGFDESGRPIVENQPLDMTPLPLIVIVVDEMADLMMVAGKDIEAAIQRLAQMARAAGIHLIMATQRPSVDVITGTIKANFPTRISFQVTSKIDSRTILGEQGAEQLLGQGDMLYMAGGGQVSRIHGPLVSDSEVESIVTFLKDQADPEYIEEVTKDNGGEFSGPNNNPDNRDNSYYDSAVALVAREGKASTSFIQRHLQIGYNRAATIMEQLEEQGVVSKADRVGRREVLVGRN